MGRRRARVSAVAAVTLRLLGGFRLERAGAEIATPGAKGRALLAYLALNADRGHAREPLATLLWGDRGDEQARHSLRQCVLSLRKALGDDDASLLVSEGDRLRLDAGAIALDVRDFERLAAAGTREALEGAAALYGGGLLEGESVRADDFEAWLAAERSRWRNLAVDVLGRLANLRAEAGETAAAIDTAQRLLILDPAHEEGHRALMQLYDRAGRRTEALRQYRVCEEAIRRELDAEPEPETVRVYEQIRTRQRDEPDAAQQALEVPSQDRIGSAVAGDASPHTPASAQPMPALRRPARWAPAVVALVVILAAAGYYWGWPNPSPTPDKPFIAVLPFENIGPDAAEENFVDGVTEDITTALSTISNMFVIARSSALVYRDKPVNVERVAEELGVRYVLVGGVQHVGDRVRVSAQLIDENSGHNLWAERYDREITDIFELQDEITLEIITALQVELTEGEQERISLIHGTSDLEAWVLAGKALQLLRRLTREDNVRARDLYRQSTEADPNYPGAWDGLAWTHWVDARFGWGESLRDSALRASKFALKALALDPTRPGTYALLGSLSLLDGNHAEAVVLGEKAVALSPSGADVAALLALTLTYTSELDRSIALINQAMRLSPHYPDWYTWTLGRAHRLAGRYKEATEALTSRLENSPDALAPRVELVATYSEMGRNARATAEVTEVLRISPNFSVREWTKALPHEDSAMTKREIDSLRKAGLPD